MKTITATEIARRTGRSPKAVLAALKRINARTTGQIGKIKLYPESTVASVTQAMRKPNGSR